jgi:GNAT superfamily N-acetyltransferase
LFLAKGEITMRTALAENLIERPARLDDVAGVVALMNACSMQVIGETDESVEDTLAHWQMPGSSLEEHHRVVVAPDGQVVGYAEIDAYSRPSYPFLDIYVHPDHEASGIGEHLAAWCEGQARLSTASVEPDVRLALRGAMYQQDTYYRELLESIGMTCIRHSWRMAIDLDTPSPEPVWPEGVIVRTANMEQDSEAILKAHRAMWRDQWGYVERPYADHLAQWESQWRSNPDFDPTCWFLAVAGEEIIGIALCQPTFPGDAAMACWVSRLGVLRPWRRRGIALALLYHLFGEFRQRGKARVGLGVDASSLTGATHLYERAGMHIAQQFDLYEKELRPGRDLSVQALED